MAVSRIHHTNWPPGIAIWGGSDYYLRTRWALSDALLDNAAGRDSLNYFEGDPVYVGVVPTPEDPVILRCDALWWDNQRETQRYVYAATEWVSDPNSPWQQFRRSQFIINHDPIANAGPDQIVTLDSAGTLLSDIDLDGRASSDPDSGYPDHIGPLKYSWDLESAPATADMNGAVGSAASNLMPIPDPLFLPVATAVPSSDRGMYTFRLTVEDGEVATDGIRVGKTGSHSASTRVFVESVPPDLTIVSPRNNAPYVGNWDDNLGGRLYIPFHYSVGTIGVSAAYGGAWIVRITVRQAVQCPFGGSPPVGTIVFRAEKISPNLVDSIMWDGVISEGAYAGDAALGGFTIELELLDRNGQPVAQPGSPGDQYAATETNAVAIDLHRWVPPVELPQPEVRLTGTFMESGHGAPANPHLHEGVDIGPGLTPSVANPSIIAVASGKYRYLGGGPNIIEIEHTPAVRSRYLHSVPSSSNPSDGSLVLQGQVLGSMSNQPGPPTPVHLHFELRTQLPAPVPINPLSILDLVDEHVLDGVVYPIINGVYCRVAQAAGLPATLAASGILIAGPLVDIVVHCRDRAHPDTPNAPNSTANAPFGVRLSNSAGQVIGSAEFGALLPGDALTNYYTLEGSTTALCFPNHYQLYFRVPAPTGRDTGPVSYQVQVYDFPHGLPNATTLIVAVGADVRVIGGPPIPALTVGGGSVFQVTIEVTRRTNVSAVDEDFHIELLGAPAGWTVSVAGSATPSRTGVLVVGAPTNIVLTIDSHGAKPPGDQNFEIVVYSHILTGVGTRLPVTARIQ